MSEKKSISKGNWFAYGIFWSWNIIFIAFMTLGFAPRILPEMILAVGLGAIPINFLFYALILTLVPVFAVILGLTALRRHPWRLFALGYVIEGPLMMMLAIRFFLIRESTSSTTSLMVLAGLGMAAFLWYLLDPEIERRGTFTSWLRLAGLTLMLLASLYAAVWIAFYALPLAVEAIRGLLNLLANLPDFLQNLSLDFVDLIGSRLIWIPFTLLGIVLGLYTATIVVLMPVVVPYLCLRAWWRTIIAFSNKRSWLQPAIVVIFTLFLCGLMIFQANYQPQHEAFSLLETPPSNIEEAESLLQQEESIRRGLLNAYLAPFRYLSAMGEVYHVRWLYEDTFDMTTRQAAVVQNLYENVTRPFLYSPVHPPNRSLIQDNLAFQQEPEEAAELYQQFFDEPILDGEQAAIVDAVRSTWSFNQAEAAWLAVDDREVYLSSQQIQILEMGDWAVVEIHEVYQNQTTENQEVVYYLNLPESAVFTGLWLGESPDVDQRSAFQVAPRGAAQAVYRNEVRRQVDPALLEQIGPRQYRLRVYPVPPVETTWDETRAHTMVKDAPSMHLWISYKTLAGESVWPLPELAYKHNVYWDENTERVVNSEPLKLDDELWLPHSIPIDEPITRKNHRIDLPNGESVIAIPEDLIAVPDLPDSMRLAVILDRSRSMAIRADQVSASLAELEATLKPGTLVDVYLTSSPYRGEAPVRVSLEAVESDQVIFFGGQNAGDLLAQFEQLRGKRTYDAILVFTDESGYELGESELAFPIPDAPVWMVHQGGDLPLGYDDRTLEAIQASGGGVVGDLENAVTRIAVSLSVDEDGLIPGARNLDLLDGYVWGVLPTSAVEAATTISPSEEGFAALAARRYILAETQRQLSSLGQLNTLDQLHELAVESGIVTPYSSMIVLVEASQQRLLADLSSFEDRYEREVEALGKTTPSTTTPLVGVPEPHEWLLLGIATIMLVWFIYRRQPAWLRGGFSGEEV
jgi:putative PEP-CTERM system integral membrane protein